MARVDEKRLEEITGFLRENALFLGLLAALVLGYLVLRQGTSSIASTDEFDAALAGGGPVLLVFYSDT